MSELLWCFVCGVGQLHERLVEPYRTLPFCMASLLNTEMPLDEKKSLSEWFCGLQDCCLDTAFGVPLKAQLESPADLMPTGKRYMLLQACFQSKNCTLETENNFARLQSMKRATRGRSDIASSLAAKHLLSEIKLSHLKQFRLWKKKTSSSRLPHVASTKAFMV